MLTREEHKSAALSSIVAIGLLYIPLRGLIGGPDGTLRIAQPGMLLAMIAEAAVLILFLMAWRYPRASGRHTRWLDAAGIAVLALPVVQIAASRL